MGLYRTIISAIVATLLSSTALACGDSLYRVGQGVSYRAYSAPLPGNLLVYVSSEAAKQLAVALARSGHDVQVAETAEELVSELNKGGYDVVIASYNEHESIESTTYSFLPIAETDEEERLAKQSYDQVMVSKKHEIKHYLKAIHSSLQARI